MKKIWSVVFLVAAMATVGQAQAGFMDKLKSVTSVGASSVTEGGGLSGQDFEVINSLFKEADGLLQNSLANLVEMVCNKEVTAELKRQMQAAQEIKDPKEREAAISKVKEDQAAALLAASENQETAGKLSELSGEQKKLASDSLYNLVLAGLKDKTVIELSNGVASKVQANPSGAISYSKEIARMKDIASTLPSQISKLFQISDNMIKLAGTGKIEVVVPQTSTDPAKEVAL